MRPVVPLRLAEQDVEDAFVGYLSEAAGEVAAAFADALERAMSHISRHPGSGSPRYAHDLSIPGLRHWPQRKFPYLIFYLERSDRVEVWRVLHGQRDIPAWMQGQE